MGPPRVFHKFWTVLIFILTLKCVSIEANHHRVLNDTCLNIKFEELNEPFNAAFKSVAEATYYNHAKITKITRLTEDKIEYEVDVRWEKGNVTSGKIRTFSRSYTLTEDAGDLSDIAEGPLSVTDSLLFADRHEATGTSAKLFQDAGGEQYLTVNTSNATTSCTLRLGMYSDVHGRVLTDKSFGTFKISPDGRYRVFHK